MSKKTLRICIGIGLFVLMAVLMVACQGRATQVTAPTQGVPPTQAPVPTCPAAPACPTAAPQPTAGAAANVQVPFVDLWSKSPHNDAKAEAFNHWNEETPKEIPVECAACHSTPGYQDFLGADGSAAGKVDKPAPIGTTITCEACHSDAANNLTAVTFPSGVQITGLGPSARCMVCHQGRASKVQVDQQIEQFKATDPDAVVQPVTSGGKTTNFGFINIHYFAAAATLYGSQVHGGYEYDGKTYDVKFQHVTGIDSCADCHNPHSTQIKLDVCAGCHTGVKTVEDLHNVREPSSTRDYNGNGNVTEGMYAEIAGLRDSLTKGIQEYAKEVTQNGIIYDPATYPYFLLDKNNDGQPDKNDKGAVIGFTTWTPRLLKAAYNLHVSVKDPGAYAHGNKYIVQLLFDSMEDLNTKLTTKIDMSKMHREDAGHFAGDTMAFRDWDTEGEVPGTCSRCHSATGLPQFIKEGVTSAQPIANGFQCSTCHDETAFPAVYKMANVTFPSGATVTFGENDPANLCLACHQGRESSMSVENAVKGLDPDTPSDKIRFRNVHYFAGGATLFGSEVHGMYEYPNKTYAGRFMHTQNFDKCTACHEKHILDVNGQICQGCHQTNDPAKIRMNSKEDYNGNGNTTEGLEAEVAGMRDVLYQGIQAYAKDVVKVPIIYDTSAYPYFFLDKNGDGKPDTDDKGNPISYNAWTPRLLKAGYNLQYAYKDPGAFVHNAHYVMQALYDSIADLKTKVPSIDNSKLIRPK